MRKLILVFAASLLCFGAWAQDEIVIERTFDLTCVYPEDWNDLTEMHMFTVSGTYSHPYNRNGSIDCRVDYSEDWMDLTGVLEPGDAIESQFSVTFDTYSWHSIEFRIIDEENETIYVEPFEFPDVEYAYFYGIEDKVYTGEAQTQENLDCYSLSSGQYEVTNYRNNTEVGTASFDVIGVFPYSIGRTTLTFQIFDANNPEWTLLQELRTALVNQGNEEWADEYWPMDNGIAGVNNWDGVTMSDGHVTELNLWNYDLHLDSIPQAAFRFPYLQILRVTSKALTGKVEDVVTLTDIPCAQSLTELNLSSNHFTGNIGAFAKRFPNLESLDVSSNRIAEVNPMISPNVTTLWLSDQQIDSVYTMDFRAPLSREGLLATLPSILLYNHPEQAFVENNSLSFSPDIEDYDAWNMYLYTGMDPEYYGSEFSLATWQEDPAYRYHSGDTLYLQSYDATCRAKVLFKMCDADFSGAVDVADLQMMLNYITGWMSYSAVINFTASDLYRDSILNVQDVVRMVDTLLTHEVSVVFEAPRRAVAAETAEAALYWLNGELHLYSTKPVASMQLAIATEQAVTWHLNGEWMKGERTNGEGANVVLYSLSGATMPAETDIVLAQSTGEATVRAAALSDPAAKRISAQLNSPAVATGVDPVTGNPLPVTHKILRNGQLYIMYKGTMYDVQGKRVNDQITK